MLKYGKISDRINSNTNNVTIKDEIAIIDLYDTIGNKIGETIIDAEDDILPYYHYDQNELILNLL